MENILENYDSQKNVTGNTGDIIKSLNLRLARIIMTGTISLQDASDIKYLAEKLRDKTELLPK